MRPVILILSELQARLSVSELEGLLESQVTLRGPADPQHGAGRWERHSPSLYLLRGTLGKEDGMKHHWEREEKQISTGGLHLLA